MSEPRLISPMLDGCIIGQAISCHNGVRCCPAIRQSTDEKYIVKIISIPASQVQLEALLLTGAYENNDAALQYFMELSEDILKEKDILADLSQLEGFTPYLDAQIVPMEDGIGYEVYLMSPYKRSVEKILSSDTLTHLSVVNMGLDMCAALAACRRAGYLYVDLKPGNIFLTENQDYRIGDLGFTALASLKYATLPEKYHSPYSPAEVTDPMAVLNDTVDTYALGLVLYQAYNGGKLPVAPMQLGDPFVPPMYADYEMAEIILKACAPKPEDRWADPTQMGQALVSYMQRNCVNDDPIIPPVLEVTEPEVNEEEVIEEFLPEPEEEPEELAFLQELTQDETAPSEENTSDLQEAPVTEETSQMLAQADDLICHELPEPVVAPDPIEVPIPEPIYTGAEPELEDTPVTASEEPAEEAAKDPETVPESSEVTGEVAVTEAPSKPRKKRHSSKLIIILLTLLLTVSCLGLGGQFYYQNIYLQTIDSLQVTGTENMLTVHVDTNADETLLQVVCTDSYGNTKTQPVTAGLAIFHDLDPQTRYTIRVEISGLHQLAGMTSTSFTTSSVTVIDQFTASTGPTDGSVFLSFSYTGQGSSRWLITYWAEGIPEKTVSTTSQNITINDLQLGAEYTFRLSSEDALNVIGATELTHTAGKPVFAQDIQVTACSGGNMTVVWNAPEGSSVGKWIIWYYSSDASIQTLETTDTTCTLTGIDHTQNYTIEVFAEGMAQSSHIVVKPNPITIHAFHFDATKPGYLQVKWDYSGATPEGGWLVDYTVNGLKYEKVAVQEAQIALPALPDSHYTITVYPTSDVMIFSNTAQHELPSGENFAGFGITAADIQVKMCLRPEREFWNWTHVGSESFTTSFAVGQRAGFVLALRKDALSAPDSTLVTYTVKDSQGNLIHLDTATSLWSNLIQGKNGALNIPFMPDQPGQYSISIYFNGKLVTVQNFSIV